MAGIHPTAVVEDGARIADGVDVGPYCIVGGSADLGPGVVLTSHVVVGGRTTIGAGCRVFPFASLGLAPQDLKYGGEPSALVIGERNTIREYVTMNPGTRAGGMETRIGDDCLFMVGSHVAHDCRIGNGVILANNATLAGHVTVEDRAIIGGLSAAQQFVRIGRNAIIGGMTGIDRDVVPYAMVLGERGRLRGANVIGLERHGYSDDEIREVSAAIRRLFRDEDATLEDRKKEVRARFSDSTLVRDVLEFMEGGSDPGFCRFR